MFRFFLFLFFTISFCNHLNSQSTELQLLNKSFQLQNDSLLHLFFENWQRETLIENVPKEPILADLDILFQGIYEPENLNKISGLTTWDSVYAGIPYYIVQNDIKIGIVKSDSLQKTGKYYDSTMLVMDIDEFRPQLQFKNTKTLYLTDKYSKILTSFFEDSAAANASSQKSKLKFLGKYVKIVPDTAQNWFFETRPIVQAAYFNRTQKIARIDFCLFSQGGSAYFVKENEQWRMIWSGITWRE